MAVTTKTTFNHFQHDPTKNLLDSLVSEVIQARGMDMYYLPRTRGPDFDAIYHESAGSSFNTAYQIPIYIKSADGFMGQEALMSHFGIESRLQLVLTIGRSQWDENVKITDDTMYRPREGDLIQVTDFDHRIYEIKWVDDHPYFYQHGHLPMWDLTVELFEFGGEEFNTGVDSIDCIGKKTSIDAYDWTFLTEDGLILTAENDDIITREQFITAHAEIGIIDSNDEFEDAANTVIDWSTSNPFGEGRWGNED